MECGGGAEDVGVLDVALPRFFDVFGVNLLYDDVRASLEVHVVRLRR